MSKVSSKKSGRRELTPRTRSRPVFRYQAFLAGLAKYGATPDFPNFFADGSFAAQLGDFVKEVSDADQAKAQKRDAVQKAAAVRTQGDVLLEGGEGALVAAYGPSSPTLADFGIKPKKTTRARRKKKAAGAGGGGEGASAATGPSAGSGSSASPSSPATGAPATSGATGSSGTASGGAAGSSVASSGGAPPASSAS